MDGGARGHGPGLEALALVWRNKANPYATCVRVCACVFDGKVVAFLLPQAVLSFKLNEFICLANLTKAWTFSPCWLVPVSVQNWSQCRKKIKHTVHPF